MTSPYYVGIDPGAKGALVSIQMNGVAYVNFDGMSERDIYTTISMLGSECRVVLERVTTAIFGANKSSAAKLYGSYMSIRMALVATETQFSVAMGNKWQRAIGVPVVKGMSGTERKEKLRLFAKKLYPKLPVWDKPLYVQRGMCDALLIAHYCKLKHERKL